ncbi:outer dense fiber protein 2 isoform 2-T2 [Pelodytes ibericus]
MKNRSPSPPLHVHVDESTPIHVHIKKSQRTTNKLQPKGGKPKIRGEVGNLRRSAKVKTKVPWVPPGKTSVRDSGFKWEGLTHRLDITPPDMEKSFSALQLSDLSTEQEESIRDKITSCDRKINSLMSEVGTLKNEVELQRKGHLVDWCQETLATSKRLKDELAEVSLAESENEDSRTKTSRCRQKEGKDFYLLQELQEEKSHLLSKLVEAEIDGAEAAKQVSIMRDAIHRMRLEKSMNSTDVNLLIRQKEVLLQKLNTFEATNRSLRSLLSEQHCREVKTHMQKQLLLKKLSDSDTDRVHLQTRLDLKEKEVDDLLLRLETDKDLVRTTTEFTKSLEATRAHLQGQLRKSEGENNRLSVQLRNLERSEGQYKEEFEQLKELYSQLKQKVDTDKDALKKSARAHKQRAERNEEALQRLNAQLVEKNTELSKSQFNADTWKNHYSALVEEKKTMEANIAALSNRVSALLEDRQNNQEKARVELEHLEDKLHKQITENTFLKLEREKQKSSLSTVEEKLTLAHGEVQQLKSSQRQYEGLVDTYKDQVEKSRMEAEEFRMQSEMAQKENKMKKEEMNRELDEMRWHYQSRLAELEQLPELLKLTERKLQDCQDQLRSYEQKNSELTSVISELRVRMEQQGDKMESARDRYQSSVEENKRLVLKVQDLERRLDDAGIQNRELLQVVSKREESINQTQLRLEEKTRECAALTRQLEASIEDSRRQVDQARERVSSKERVTQSKILDLETQLSRTKAELNQFKRNKDDAERRFQSRLQDLKDRLEQSETTNKSMQNYVQFLKSSYDNVFGESALTSSPIRPRSPL